ncbi:MAG: tRNA pseudouridine(55) synthase TruB [Phormidesmis sp.]
MINGFINLYKPAEWTSHDCVARVRRLLNTKKVGHSGTLDPLATGVLPLAVGKATRLLQYLPAGKAYRAVIRFGLKTTTDDLEGEVLQQQSASHLQRQQVEAMFSQFVGSLTQIPPMYSAVQVDGKRLYDLARQGKAVEVPSRQVMIHQLHSQKWQAGDQPELTVDVVCGPGTYIRALARDMGETMGTGAVLVGLSRTHSNGFDVDNSVTLEALEAALAAEAFVPVAAGSVMQHLEAIALPSELAHRWCLGQKLAIDEVAPYLSIERMSELNNVPLRVIDAATQDFLGIGEVRMGTPTGQLALNEAALTDAASQSKVFAAKRVFATL